MKLIQKKYLTLFLSIAVFSFLVFSPVHAALVPCGTTGGSPCTLCHLITGFSNLVTWIRNIVFTAAMTGLIIGGVVYMISSGSTSTIETAKGIIKASLVGFALTLCAWLIVNTIMQVVAAKGDLGVSATNWYTFECDKSSNALTGAGGEGGKDNGDKQAQNQAECDKYCKGNPDGAKTDYEKCMVDCMNAKGAEDNKGNGGVLDSAKQMMNSGCQYSKKNRNGCAGNPGYTDCSNFVCTSYKNAGCSCPGNVSGDYAKIAQPISDSSSLQPGDVLSVPGHVVMCENVGCSTVIGASGEKAGIKESNGSYYLNKGAKVVRASDYCN